MDDLNNKTRYNKLVNSSVATFILSSVLFFPLVLLLFRLIAAATAFREEGLLVRVTAAGTAFKEDGQA